MNLSASASASGEGSLLMASQSATNRDSELLSDEAAMGNRSDQEQCAHFAEASGAIRRVGFTCFSGHHVATNKAGSNVMLQGPMLCCDRRDLMIYQK